MAESGLEPRYVLPIDHETHLTSTDSLDQDE